MNICIFGSASDRVAEKYIAEVEKLGEILAEKGHSLVFGAGSRGLMGASARGFARKGGKIYGVIPTFFKNEYIEEVYMDCTELTYTETMAQRKAKMEDLADAFIIAPGGIGTFEEFFEVLTLKQLRRHTKPIAIYNIFGYYDSLIDSISYSMDEKFINTTCKELFTVLNTPDEVLEFLANDQPLKRSVSELKNG